ncbi:hypothetical protein [Escherichia coli]|nr:hypothetical protein [Escherichia coli]
MAGEEDWSGRRTVYIRDEQGRLAEKHRPDGSVWRYAREGKDHQKFTFCTK